MVFVFNCDLSLALQISQNLFEVHVSTIALRFSGNQALRSFPSLCFDDGWDRAVIVAIAAIAALVTAIKSLRSLTILHGRYDGGDRL